MAFDPEWFAVHALRPSARVFRRGGYLEGSLYDRGIQYSRMEVIRDLGCTVSPSERQPLAWGISIPNLT